MLFHNSDMYLVAVDNETITVSEFLNTSITMSYHDPIHVEGSVNGIKVFPKKNNFKELTEKDLAELFEEEGYCEQDCDTAK